MRTCTVTWISYKNYGTFLQAYALQSVVKSLGHENVILSDKPIVEKNLPIEIDMPSYSSYKAGRTGSFIYELRIIHGFIHESYLERILLKTNEKFDEFCRKDLNVFGVYSPSDYEKLNYSFDLFICGSDQIWSLLDHNFNEYFFLSFTEKTKIAYAPSFGQSSFPEKYQVKICELLKDFKALSCREESSAFQLSNLLKRDVSWVCDPTFLLSSSDWKKFSSKRLFKRKYVLCYFLENKNWYFMYAEQIAKYFGVEFMLIPSRKEYIYMKPSIKKIIGPREFVSLVRDAEFVLTDSYHGSIFSLIFNKQFLYLKRFSDGPMSQNIRITSLFNYLGITQNIIEKKLFEEKDFHHLNYTEINKKIDAHREYSLNYLKGSLRHENQ